MLTIDVKSDIATALKKFEALEPRQFPFIVALAMNRTFKLMGGDMRAEMEKDFDRPTPWTLNSLQIVPATKELLEGGIKLKDFGGKGIAANKYLGPEIYGGPRRPKRFENALKAYGYLPDDMFAVPAKGLALDQYGNIPGGLINKILSYIRSNPDATQNRTARSKGNKNNQGYFVMKPNNVYKLPAGIYQRNGATKRMIIAFVKQPVYNKRYRFYEVGEAGVTKYFAAQLQSAAEYAISTSNTRVKIEDFTNALEFIR